jgi:hypothetical protein
MMQIAFHRSQVPTQFRCNATSIHVIVVYLRYVVDPPAWSSTFLMFVPYPYSSSTDRLRDLDLES